MATTAMKYEMVVAEFRGGIGSIPTFTIRLADSTGKQYTEAATGETVIKAATNAINRVIGFSPEEVRFSINQRRNGAVAVCVTIGINDNGRHEGRRVANDVNIAYAMAYLEAINHRLWVDGLVVDPRVGLNP